jgi:fructokinase
VRIGIDLGGTKIEAVALAPDGTERFRRRVPAPRGNYTATLDAVAALVEAAELVAGPSSVGVGIPGVVSPATGLVKNANSTWLNGRPLAEDLEARLARSVRLANDANCFALSEASDGAGMGRRIVFGVIIGTGTGGGLVVDGRVILGANAIAGEWGHNPLPWPEPGEWPGPPCYCGRTGCIETFLSGPGLSRDHALATGAHRDPAAIAARASEGDRDAQDTLQRYQRRMARALASVVNIVDPDVVVLGGGLSAIPGLPERVMEAWGRFVFSDHLVTSIVPALHGAASGVRGAAWLWPPR